MDSEMHLAKKLDYVFFQSSQVLQVSEMELLKNQYKQEQTQILVITMLSLGNLHSSNQQDTCSMGIDQSSWKPTG